LSFTENASTGALTTLATTSLPGTTAVPTALAETPTGGFLFVTDSSANMVYTYRLAGGLPASLPTSQATTGLTPAAVTIEPRGLFAYIANYGASTVGTYAINASTGALTSTGATESVGTGPSCVAIDPALGIYLYTSNNLSSSVSGEQLNPKTGALENIQGTPFNSQPLPTCLVAVANGAHATQLLQ
jgi:6-phosphogluconolactonase (cycloisomerase 2 family)